MSISLLHKNQPLKEGYLKKTASSKGEDIFRGATWKDRYFKLYPDLLFYFKRIEDNTPAGEVDLRSALIEPVEPSETQGAPFCIRIQEAKQVWLYVQASSALERDAWLRALRRCAGVEESLEDTLAQVAAVNLKDRQLNTCAWNIYLQDLTSAGNGQSLPSPELVCIVLGSEGMFRIYRDAKLWRTYDGTQIVKIDSTMKAEMGIGIGAHWRMLCEVRVELKLHPLTSGQPSTGSQRFNFYLGAEEECHLFVPMLKSLSKNDLAPISRVCKKLPQCESKLEVYDLSFRTNWTSKYALLNGQRLIIFNNSNDPSPWRSIFLHAATHVTGEGMLGLTFSHLLEKDMITLKFDSEPERNEWLHTMQRTLHDAQQRVEIDRAHRQQLERAEQAATTATKKVYKPLTSVASFDTDDTIPPPPSSNDNGSTTSGSAALFDFDLPPVPEEAKFKTGESTFVLTFGCGSSGQLGHRNKDDSLKPTAIDSLKTKPIRCISAGATHAGLVTEQGHVYMMGSGSLGLGERMLESKAPYLLTSLLATPIRQLSCGRSHCIALTATGLVYSWGASEFGQTGTGKLDTVYYPTMIETLKCHKTITISAGGEHSACITDGGQLYSWGKNEHGSLGLGSTESQSTPVLNTALHSKGIRIAQVSCGQDFTLAISSVGLLYSCGLNHEGQLAMGDFAKRSLFVPVTYFEKKGLRVFQVKSGQSHGVALALDLTSREVFVYTFGAGISNGYREKQSHPILVAALTQTHSIHTSASAQHTLTLSNSQRPFAFGTNLFGELGNLEAGVQALVKIRLTPTIRVVQAATGTGFSMLLCKGEVPPQILAGQQGTAAATTTAASNDIPPPPKESARPEIQQALGMQASNVAPDFNNALDQITRLLQMELSLDPNADPRLRTVIEQGSIDLLKLKSVDAETGKPLVQQSGLTSVPLSSSSSSSAPALPPIPVAAVPLPQPPTAASSPSPPPAVPVNPITSVRPTATPFTFTIGSTASVPIVASTSTSNTTAGSYIGSVSSTPATSTSSSSAPPSSATVAASVAPTGVAAKIAAMQQLKFNAQPPSAAGLYRANPPAASTTTAVPVAAAAPPPPATAPAPKKEKAPLPPGWKKIRDEASGRSYYFHAPTKQTTWKRPKVEEGQAPPPPPPPQVVDPLPPPPPVVEEAPLPPPPPPTESNSAPPPPPLADDDDDAPPPPPPQ